MATTRDALTEDATPQTGPGLASFLVTVRQAGELVPALGERYIRRLVDERRIPVHRVGRKVLLDRRDLDALVAAGREEPAGGAA